MVWNCIRCQLTAPAPTIHDPGEIGTTTNWTRFAINITHYCESAYVLMSNCGFGRLVVWREVCAETAAVVVEELEKLILKRGPVAEVIMAQFSARISSKHCLKKRNIQSYYRAMYRPGGNGIVE